MMGHPRVLFILIPLVLCSFGWADSPGKAPGKRKLTRSDGRRWDRLQEFMKAEIKSQATKFLEDRDKVTMI